MSQHVPELGEEVASAVFRGGRIRVLAGDDELVLEATGVMGSARIYIAPDELPKLAELVEKVR